MTTPFEGNPAASAAVMDKVIYGDGTNEGLVLLAIRAYYDGADWQLSAQGSAFNANVRNELEAGMSWHASDYLEFDLTGGTYFRGFSGTPIAIAASAGAATRKMPADAVAISATEVRVYFYDQTTRTDQETTEDAAMDCNLIIVGLSDV